MSPSGHTWEPVQEGLTEVSGLLLDTKDILTNQGQRVKERRKQRRRTASPVSKSRPGYLQQSDWDIAARNNEFPWAVAERREAMQHFKRMDPEGFKQFSRERRARKKQKVGKAMPHPEPAGAKKKAPPPKNKPQAKEQEKEPSVEKSLFRIGMGYNKSQRDYISKRYGSLTSW